MRHAIIAVLLLSAFAGTAVAGPFEDAVSAYERGDYATALREFRVLAGQDNAEARYYLGVMYVNGLGVLEDRSEASAYYHNAGRQGHAKAQLVLGRAYDFAVLGLQQDFVAAVKWYRRSAEQGLTKAQYNLAGMYANGKGAPQDYFEALKWYKEAANQGDTLAQRAIGEMYKDGKGVPQHYGDAVKWYRLAAEQGDPAAQSELGEMYSEGKGVQQDNVMAHMWFNLAAVGYQKHTDFSTPHPLFNESRTQELSRLRAKLNFESTKRTAEARDILAKAMNSEEIAEAQKLAQEWKPK